MSRTCTFVLVCLYVCFSVCVRLSVNVYVCTRARVRLYAHFSGHMYGVDVRVIMSKSILNMMMLL